MKHQPSASGTSHAARAKKPHPAPVGHDGTDTGSPASGTDRDALVRESAYSFYEARGRVAGHELEDWLKAEMQVEQTLGAQGGPAPASGPPGH